MRHYAKLLRATLTALLMLVAVAGAAASQTNEKTPEASAPDATLCEESGWFHERSQVAAVFSCRSASILWEHPQASAPQHAPRGSLGWWWV